MRKSSNHVHFAEVTTLMQNGSTMANQPVLRVFGVECVEQKARSIIRYQMFLQQHSNGMNVIKLIRDFEHYGQVACE